MNTERFETMMRQYQRLVYSVCYQMVCDEQLAQDLAQDTFLSAWLHLDSCREGNEKAWLCRIAVNKAKDHLKSAAVRHSTVWEAEKLESMASNADMQAALESRDAALRTADLVRGLRAPYREVCVACFLSGLTPTQAAQQLGRPLCTVRTQLFRGRALLKSRLAAAV